MDRSPLVLAAVGDISFARGVEEHLDRRGAEFPFEHVLATLHEADVRFGNLESVLLPEDFPPEKISPRALRSGDAAKECLRLARFDVLNQATNHALDCGWRGLLHTSACVREAGAQPVGVGADAAEAHRMAVVERNGLRIGFLAYQEPSNATLESGRIARYDPEAVLGDIVARRREVDLLVVSVHADLEFRPAPSIPRVEACRRFVDAGADLILCHHPHVPQGIERWGEGLIVYSLGNFVFDCRRYQLSNSQDVLRAHVLLIDIEQGRIARWRRVHFRIDAEEGRPVPLSPDEAARAEEHCARLDAILADPEQLRECWYESCRHYLRLSWNRIVAPGPDGFVDSDGWRFLCNAESSNWTRGIDEMAQERYRENSRNDFEFVRPNHPFESDG